MAKVHAQYSPEVVARVQDRQEAEDYKNRWIVIEHLQIQLSALRELQKEYEARITP